MLQRHWCVFSDMPHELSQSQVFLNGNHMSAQNCVITMLVFLALPGKGALSNQLEFIYLHTISGWECSFFYADAEKIYISSSSCNFCWILLTFCSNYIFSFQLLSTLGNFPYNKTAANSPTNFISPVFICFRWWRRCEGGCFPQLQSVSTHFHPTMSISLHKTSCLYIHPPGIPPLLHLCKLVPAAGPAQAAQSGSAERRSKVLKVICRAALRQIPLASSEKEVTCLRKAKYHTDLHWAESCVLLLGGHGQAEEAVWWEMHSRDTQKRPELRHGALCTPQPSQTPLPASDSPPWAAGGC